MNFAESGFARFMSNPAGRGLRIVVGVLLIALAGMIGASGNAVVYLVVGLVALAAGNFNIYSDGLVDGTVRVAVAVRTREPPSVSVHAKINSLPRRASRG